MSEPDNNNKNNSGGNRGDNSDSMEDKMRSLLQSSREFADRAKEQYSGVRSQVGEFADKAKEQYSGVRSQVGALRGVLKEGIKISVDATNDMLAKAEESTLAVQKPIVETMRKVEDEGSKRITQGWHIYERRHEFGPHIVGGTALVFGGLAAMRRGRIPGVATAAIAGGISYVLVYEPFPLQDIPDMMFGKKDE